MPAIKRHVIARLRRTYMADPRWETVQVLARSESVSTTKIVDLLRIAGVPVELNGSRARLAPYAAAAAAERLGAMMAEVCAAKTEEGRAFCQAYAARKRGDSFVVCRKRRIPCLIEEAVVQTAL